MATQFYADENYYMLLTNDIITNYIPKEVILKKQTPLLPHF